MLLEKRIIVHGYVYLALFKITSVLSSKSPPLLGTGTPRSIHLSYIYFCEISNTLEKGNI